MNTKNISKPRIKKMREMQNKRKRMEFFKLEAITI